MSRQKRFWLAIAFVALALAVVFGGAYIYARSRVREDPGIYDRLAQPAPSPAPTAEPVEIPIDFAYWQDLNPDVYAWITIPGTEVDYPVLQSADDNSYYLTHNIDGTEGYPGCIYSENCNSTGFDDPVTILYGHNMGRGEPMFHELHKLESADFFEENREILIYLPDRILHYRIYSVYNNSDVHLMYAFDFSEEDQLQQFLDQCAFPRDMHANVDSEMKVTTQDRLLVLSTCTGVESTRLLVVAVLQEIET